MKIFVSDNGNDTIKAIDENFSKVKFSNIVTQTTDAEAENHIKSETRFKKERNNVYDCLDVTLYKNDYRLGRYYIGNLSVEYFGTKAERRNQNIPKAKADQTYICSAVATSLNLIKSNPNKDDIKENIIIAGLLPMGEFLEQSLVDYMAENLAGKFKVEFNRGILKGKVVEFIVEEDNCYIFPEGGIALDGLRYDVDGIEDRQFINKVKNRYILGFDIGSISTIMAGMLNDEPIPQFCDSIGEGINQALNRIKEVVESYIKNKYDKKVRITIDELNAIILNMNCKYPFMQTEIDISEFVDVELNRSVKSIINEFDNRIDDTINNKTYGIYCFGGGSTLMKKLIESRLSDRFNIMDVENSIWLNAVGSIKVLKNMILSNN